MPPPAESDEELVSPLQLALPIARNQNECPADGMISYEQLNRWRMNWFNKLSDAAEIPRFDEDIEEIQPAHIFAQSVDHLSIALLNLVIGLITGNKPDLPDARHCAVGFITETGIEEWVSSGMGLERGMFTAVFETIVLQDKFWSQSPANDTNHIPYWLSGRLTRSLDAQQHFEAHGALIAMHILIHGAGPARISIWIVLAIVLTKEKFYQLPDEFIQYVDPAAFTQLQPWLQHKNFLVNSERKWRENENLTPKVCQALSMLVGRARINLADLPEYISQSEYGSLTEQIKSWLFLNHDNPWETTELQAISKGFHRKWQTGAFSPKSLNMIHMIQEYFTLETPAPMIGRLFCQKIVDVDQILKGHLVFETNDLSPHLEYVAKIFELRLVRYLQQPGHATDCNGIIPQYAMKKAFKDPVLRARLLLLACTDMELLPSDPNWKIKFSFSDADIDWCKKEIPKPLTFRACFSRVDVSYNQGLRDILVESLSNGSGPDYLLLFDHWFHEQLVSAPKVYNIY
ncbi:hypothetical protein K435DRAFT_849652 [Dendrothele bispora CBS 962.96]|uniref:HECT domain-containing protein n=1 Tax=Dendrothele bispora (strain CBS 962.96) TaxID=1314807 RepID=A0A4S8MS20_DENBC|nr:hypothetical protein K435DRAFT_849652 [Dendrothele bispora CBS 962.96]